MQAMVPSVGSKVRPAGSCAASSSHSAASTPALHSTSGSMGTPSTAARARLLKPCLILLGMDVRVDLHREGLHCATVRRVAVAQRARDKVRVADALCILEHPVRLPQLSNACWFSGVARLYIQCSAATIGQNLLHFGQFRFFADYQYYLYYRYSTGTGTGTGAGTSLSFERPRRRPTHS